MPISDWSSDVVSSELFSGGLSFRKPDITIGVEDNPYLRRLYIIPRNRWFNVYLHEFLRDDDDRALHDHPWVNLSILLRGQYVEHTATGATLRRAGAIKFRLPTAAHRIALVDGDPVWTLFIPGPRLRGWISEERRVGKESGDSCNNQ